jgi:hypothetical protein
LALFRDIHVDVGSRMPYHEMEWAVMDPFSPPLKSPFRGCPEFAFVALSLASASVIVDIPMFFGPLCKPVAELEPLLEVDALPLVERVTRVI